MAEEIAFFGPALRFQRQIARVTSDELAEEIGVEGSTVRRWERGQTTPSEEHVQSMLAALEIEADDLSPTSEWARKWGKK